MSDEKIRMAVEEYQCSGCIGSPFEDCYTPQDGITCGKHVPGTVISGIGRILLGLPKGFHRLGPIDRTIKPLHIFERYEDGWDYDMFNIPVWKHLNGNKHTIIRGLCPRINCPFIHIFLENCMDRFDCLEITESDIEEMD